MTDIAEDWYRQVIDGTSYAVIAADGQGVIRVWNDAAGALLGYTAAAVRSLCGVQTVAPYRSTTSAVPR